MEFYGDYHLHSTYSDGHSSVEEMVKAASGIGLEEICLADHGPRNFAVGVESAQTLLQIKEEIKALREKYTGLQIYAGVEANIISLDGQLDVEREIIEKLDLLIAGLHSYVWPEGFGDVPWILGNQVAKVFPLQKKWLQNANTKALVEAIYRYEPEIISHPGLKMEINIAEVAKACLAKETLWEINAGHKHPGYKEVREIARRGVEFVVNSDAHFPESVGALEYGAWVLEKAGVPAPQIRNIKEKEHGHENIIKIR
ncbi:MAG TPA: PHP domain-containing protein [Clostridia bacterium]|nr:PHP domain-containing protein [Clostridia bacterium]